VLLLEVGKGRFRLQIVNGGEEKELIPRGLEDCRYVLGNRCLALEIISSLMQIVALNNPR